MPEANEREGPRREDAAGDASGLDARRRSRRERLSTALALGVPALAAAAAILLLLGPGDGSGPGEPAPEPPETEVAAVSGSDAGGREAPRGAGERSGRIGGPRAAAPQRLALPSLGIDTELVATGSNAQGIVIPPPEEAGWLSSGPRPGEPGRTVLVGHLDSTEGPAIFYEIGQAEAGDPVLVENADGETLEFEITGVSQIAKSSFPAETVYQPTSKSTMVLITCGGAFDPETGYEDNVIAYAKLAAGQGGEATRDARVRRAGERGVRTGRRAGSRRSSRAGRADHGRRRANGAAGGGRPARARSPRQDRSARG